MRKSKKPAMSISDEIEMHHKQNKTDPSNKAECDKKFFERYETDPVFKAGCDEYAEKKMIPIHAAGRLADELRERKKRDAGRYTLKEAAKYVAGKTNEATTEERLLADMESAVLAYSLTTFNPNTVDKYVPKPSTSSFIDLRNLSVSKCESHVNGWHAEAFWYDLNDWLRKHKEHLVRHFPDCIFPAPNPLTAAEKQASTDAKNKSMLDTTPTQITTHTMQTRDMPLDVEIATAKSKALDKTNVQSVWDELVKMASKQEGCLIGEGDLNELQYGSRQSPQIFKKNMLRDRMRERKGRVKPR